MIRVKDDLGERTRIKALSIRRTQGENTMNPLNWRREHQVALVVAAIVGIFVGLAVGYMYHHVQYATSGPWFSSWSGMRWGIFGAIIGAAVLYIRQLVHT